MQTWFPLASYPRILLLAALQSVQWSAVKEQALQLGEQGEQVKVFVETFAQLENHSLAGGGCPNLSVVGEGPPKDGEGEQRATHEEKP